MNVDEERERKGGTDDGKEVKSPIFFSVWISWGKEEEEGKEIGGKTSHGHMPIT